MGPRGRAWRGREGVSVAQSWAVESLAVPVVLLIPLVLCVGGLLATVAWLGVRLASVRRALAAEAAARVCAVGRGAWLDAALEAGADGVLVADSALRVVHWNRRFAELSGLPQDMPQDTPQDMPQDMPREGATLAALLRLSAEAGEFGLTDVNQEVAHQLALIAQGPGAFPLLRHRPDGSIVEFDLATMPDGGVLLRCADVTRRHRPAAAPAVAAPAAAVLPAPATRLRPRRCLVLLVEDMQVNQVVTATQLRRDGHRVDVAGSGAEALHMAAATPYDIVLMDLMMPGMSGYEAAKRLRKLAGPVARVPIFALTANTGEEERARCLAAGMQGMLSKPVPAARLREVLRKEAGAAAVVAQVPGDGLLDGARLAELRRDLPQATLAVLCRQCLDDMRELVAALVASLARAAAEPVEREAHALAGMAGSYGLARVERQARAIMAPARGRDMAGARAAARGLADAFDQSRAALLSWAEARG